MRVLAAPSNERRHSQRRKSRKRGSRARVRQSPKSNIVYNLATRPPPQQLHAIVGAATLMPPSAREAYIREAAGGDEELVAELMALLDSGSASKFFGKAAQLLADDNLQSAHGAPQAAPSQPAAERQFLKPGTRVGAYTIVAPLGAGGMGEVYRATDSQLQREVAIKVLPAAVATHPGLIDRLRREAKLLAAVNHQNIAAIYGIHESDGVIALILELVEGPTLAERLADGRLALNEALRLARQVAEALEAAHDKGIVHRDLKPENIKVRHSGDVKVLDFGIAKALNQGDAAAANENASLTLTGAVFGTPAYMSPEQIRGLPVDRRTDLWSFGLLLWELVTGRQPFSGTSVEARMTAVLTTEPDWTALPSDLPPALLRLLRRALQKDRKLRLDSAAVARLEIDEALAPRGSTGSRYRHVPWGITAVSVLALGVMSVLLMNPRQTPQAPVRVNVELGADIALRDDLGPAAVISPDGSTVVFATRATEDASKLYVRRLSELAATPLSSTEGATSPFFSPDGKWIAFFADRKLKRISASGGTATVIGDAPNGRGGWWATDDTIVFTSSNAPQTTVSRVRASGGGSPESITTLVDGEVSHRWPQMLPGNRAVLYTSSTSDNWDEARVMVQPLPTGAPKVVQSGFFGRYVPSGHLLYVRSGTLFAAPFDAAQLQVTGPSVAVFEDVRTDPTSGGAQLSVSDVGSLVYLHGRGNSPNAPAVWMDRGGNILPLRGQRSDWGNPQFSHDGRQLAFEISDGRQADVWVQDLVSGRLARLTFDPADDFKPVWSPDGEWIVFASTRDGVPNLYRIRSSGAGGTERLTTSPNPQLPGSWHPGGRFLAFEETRPGTGIDLMIMPVPAAGTAASAHVNASVFASGPAVEAEPIFSPDGRWIAYRSSETGRAEVFVQSFASSGKWQVSNGGGRDAAWSRTRPELLFFGTTQDRVMTAPYTVRDDSFRAGTPMPWSIVTVGRLPRGGRAFDLHADGERVVVAPAKDQVSDRMTFVSDFVNRLRQLAPTPK
jgi:serine/threonine protein kinase/Tol biopolymer transport system component